MSLGYDKDRLGQVGKAPFEVEASTKFTLDADH